jgi:hypothetical protein
MAGRLQGLSSKVGGGIFFFKKKQPPPKKRFFPSGWLRQLLNCLKRLISHTLPEMSSSSLLVPGSNKINGAYLPTPQHLNWTQTRIYQSSSFPPAPTAGPPQVNPITINLPNDIQFNELIGITVLAYRVGAGSAWNQATDTIQWNVYQFDGTGIFSYETGSGCISNVANTDGYIQALYGADSVSSQQNWFYFESTAPEPVQFRQIVLWSTGTPNAGANGGIEIWLYRQAAD